MLTVIIIAGITCLTMIAGVLFFPQIKLNKLKIDSYWVIVLLGAIIMIVAGGVDLEFLWQELTSSSSINPIKILTLFISTTILSIFLDEVGFFSYLACRTLHFAGNSQRRLFLWLYLIVSFLTVFTSNDIIILTFTPFICYFCKSAKINPLPYLITEFVAANTMSMTLIIGNPTNIYIATSYGINFIEYLKVMILPTLAAATVAFCVLYLLFRHELKKPVMTAHESTHIENKPFLIIGLVHLIICTLMLAIGPYINIDMYLVSLVSAVSLTVIILIFNAVKKQKPREILNTYSRAPWQLIPFVLSMFVIILALKENAVTDGIYKIIGEKNEVVKYGILSFLSANVINNIPMSVLFCPIIASVSGAGQIGAIYATVIGSNVGAFLTPIGALAGIMWCGMLKERNINLSFFKFVKYGFIISIPTLSVALTTLSFIV